MFILMVSRDTGASYNKDAQADSKEELKDRMDQLDYEGLRWYLADGGGEQLFGVRICTIHKRLIGSYLLARINGQNLPSRKVG